MSTTITPTEQNIEINVNNDVIDINVTNEIVDVNATTQQIDINVAGAYPIPNPVLSVFGRTGVVVATEGDYTLTQLGDVTLTSPTNGQVLKYNGTTWVNGTDAGGLTSVGLSMPTAFTVTNSPLTSNGTIAVTGAGTTAQYVRGDGTLATFPSIITQAQNLVTEVYNKTGATLTKGTIVYINGGQGNLPTVTKALAVGDSTSAQTYGVVQTDITNMNNGYVVVAGRLSDLDTQAYTEGTQLYLSSTTAGTWTSTKQYAPNHLVYVGIVVRAHPTQGIVEIKIQNGYELDEIHNVAAQTPTNNDGLFWESATNLWKNKSIATILGGTPVTGTGTTNYLAKFTGSSTIGIGQVLDDGTSVLIGTTSSTPNVKVGIYSTTQRALEVISTNSNALFVQSPAAYIATISNGTWYTNFTNTGRLDLAGDLLVNTIANATTDTDRFLVSDSGVIKYRTGAELLSDIGGQGVITNPITGTGTSGQVAYFNGTNSITSNAAFAFTPTSQLLVNNSVTAASAIARGTNLTPTLTASANNDVLVGLDINPTFTNGAFTGVANYGLRLQGASNDILRINTGTATNSASAIVLAESWGPSTFNGIYLAYHNNSFTTSGFRRANAGVLNSTGSGGLNIALDSNGSSFRIFNKSSASVNQQVQELFSTGNLLLQTGGTFTDAGYKLDVNGTSRAQTNMWIGIQNQTTSYTQSNYLFIGNSALSASNGITLGDLAINSNSYFNGTNTIYTKNGFANYIFLNSSGQTQFASAPNGTAGNTATFTQSGLIFNTGNWLLGTGTTDAGFRLDVNGTARVQGNTYIINGTNQAFLYLSSDNTSYLRGNGSNQLTLGVAGGLNTTINFSSSLILFGNNAGANLRFETNTGRLSMNGGSLANTQFAITDDNSSIQLVLRHNTANTQNYLQAQTLTGTIEAAITNGGGAFLLGDVGIGTSTLGTATKFTLGGSETASSAIARGQLLNTTLVAAANNDVLVGLDINPTFTNGAFTGVSNTALRVTGNTSITGNTTITDGTNTITISPSTSASGIAINQARPGLIFNRSGTNLFQIYDFNNNGAFTALKGFSNFGGTGILLIANNDSNRNITLYNSGNVGINTTLTDSGFKLDVNGTARVQGNATVSLNQNNGTNITVSNTTSGVTSSARLLLTSDASSGQAIIGKYSTGLTTYKTLVGKDALIYNDATGGDISILNDFTTGVIKMAAGGSSTAQLTLAANGNLTSSVNQDNTTLFSITNTTAGTNAQTQISTITDVGSLQLGKYSSTKTAYKTITSSSAYVYNNTGGGNISILNDFASGNINFAAGGASTAHMTIKSNGRINIASLPTSSSGLSSGDLWNDVGFVRIA